MTQRQDELLIEATRGVPQVQLMGKTDNLVKKCTFPFAGPSDTILAIDRIEK